MEQQVEKKKRDKARIAAWSSCVVLGGLLSLAGVYEPMPEIEEVFSGAQIMAMMGANDQARVDLAEVLRRDPDHASAKVLLASIQLQDGKYEEALANFEAGSSVMVSHDNPEMVASYYVTIGLLKLRLRDFDGARQAGDRLLSGNYRPSAGCLIRAYSHLGAGDDTSFRQELARAYALDPADPLFRVPREFLAEAIPWSSAISILR